MGYRLTTKLDTTWTKVAAIGILLMFEPILVKLYEVLSESRYPTDFELISFVILGAIQLVTYLAAFLQKE